MEVMIEKILREVKQHISKFVGKKLKQGQMILLSPYHNVLHLSSECLSFPRKICIVVPSFLQGISKGLEEMAVKAFTENSDDSTVSFICQPQADLSWYSFKSELQTGREFIIFCQAEEEITVYQLFIVH